MRILHVISSAASGGAEIYVKDLSKAMVEEGNDVFIVFLDRAIEAGRDEGFEAAFLNELDQHGIHYGFLGQACRKNPLKGVLRLRRFYKDFKPDVVHSHLYYANVFAWFLPKCNRVYTHHNIKLGAKPALYRFLDIKTDAYIGICLACQNMLEKVTRRQVEHIDNGVDASRIIPKISYQTSGTVKLLFVGRLSQQKNLSLLITAMSKLPPEAAAELMIAGEGPLKTSLETLVSELKLEDNVVFLGNCSNVKELLNNADVFVMSSAWEGLPIAQIEATLTGLPVLVTNVGGCAEIVNRVENGLVAEVNVNDYTEKLAHIVSDVAFRKRCFENAIANGFQYTVNNAVAKHLQLYSRLIEQ